MCVDNQNLHQKLTIANEIKSLLKEAGIEASPGSIKSAVASKNWVLNCPLITRPSRSDEILQNWCYNRVLQESCQRKTEFFKFCN